MKLSIPSMSRVFFFAAILLGLTSSPFFSQSPRPSLPARKTPRTLFGVSLRPETARLLSDVERRLRKPVQEEIVDFLGWGVLGESEILDDGTPVIRLLQTHHDDESLIVHELNHLKMDLFETTRYEYAPGADENIDADLLQKLHLRLSNSISHWKFYPEMRAMGFDPDLHHRMTLEDFLTLEPYDLLNTMNLNWELSPLVYVYFSLEVNDRPLLARLEDWYRENNMEPELEMAQRLLQVIRATRTNAIERQIGTYVRCLNILLKDRAQFEIIRTDPKRRGYFSTRLITIRIMPPKEKLLPSYEQRLSRG